jgi:uncharacterized protein YdeI (YjbR/CyaY-like superfamily)
MSRADEAARVHFERADEWRAWLLAHAEAESSVWLVSWRRETGRPSIDYEDAVLHALSVGWVDSTQKRLDDERTMLYFARRTPNSMWSRPNKERVERLERDGLMTEAGRRAVQDAKDSGRWSALDEVEDLVVPGDLAAALAAEDAVQKWDAYPGSQRRVMLQWIAQAKRPETRERRVAETASFAASGERLTSWPPRTGGSAPPG